MKEVIETVSEVEFKSIAVIVAVALLGMTGTWWVLTGSASPSLSAVEPYSDAGSPPEIQMEAQLQEIAPQSTQLTEPLEILVEKGNPNAVTYDNAPESLDLQGTEAAPNGFVVQLGAFQQEEGAIRRLKELEKQGFDPRLVSYEEDGDLIFRLVAGDFGTREQATAAAEDLKESGIDAFVREVGTEPR